MQRATRILIKTVACLACFSAAANADSPRDHRFSLSLGVFVTDRDTEARLDGSVEQGTPVDFERDLGANASQSEFRIDGYFKFNERHRIDFSAFDLSRSASKQIERDIQWGDTEYRIDTQVDSDIDLTIYKAAYTYSLVSRDDAYLGATAGLYVADSRASLSEATLGSSEIGELTAPLPVIGLRGEYALADRWTLRASGEFFFIQYNGVEGSLMDLYAGIDYRVLENLSVGFGFNSVTIDVDAARSAFDGALDWRYAGGLVFLKFDL